MKSTFVKVLATLLAVMMCASLASCGGNGDSATTTTGTSKAADTTTSTAATTTSTAATTTSANATSDTSKATDATTTEATTTTETPSTDTEPAPEGLIVYYQNFDGMADTTEADSNKVLEALGLKRLTKDADGVYSEGDAYFFIDGGRLLIRNYYPGDENKDKVGPNGAKIGDDAYYKLTGLTDDIMKRVVAGKYTLQYDLEYIETAGNYKRYINFVTELSADGQCYNSFHFRNGGYANNQAHFYGSWYTYDVYDASTDAFAASTNDTDEAKLATSGHSILWKLTKGEKNFDTKVQAFSGVPVTIRVQHDPDVGQTVYMKLSTQKDFTLVSAPNDTAAGAAYWNAWDNGYSVAIKLGGKQNGYLDNICIWTGFGEQPAGKEANFKG